MVASVTSEIPRRWASTEARQREILQAALRCFEEKGWEATTIADIRAECGASTGSIYHHFGNKEGIAAALYATGLEDYRTGLLATMRRARTARTLVRSIVLYHLDWAANQRSWARFLLEMRRAESVRAAEAEIRAGTRAFLEEVHELLRPRIERGEIVRLSPTLYAPIAIGPAQEVVRHWLSGRMRPELSQVKDALADAAWRSLRPED